MHYSIQRYAYLIANIFIIFLATLIDISTNDRWIYFAIFQGQIFNSLLTIDFYFLFARNDI